MADITLSKYCDQAKELIRTDSYNQAIAICRHILKHYPQYVRAYRLLGEACLEKGDYVEAANLFKRVLGADMEDMVVYVGLGIIFDEQGALDEAIWQLERAFELNPGNAEIRSELQRLYGERDGAAPPKLRLTPAALGRLYLREELYQRAIDEFRDVVDKDPDRVDIRVALAQALWWTGQQQEAASVCEVILEQYPNCLKANLILGEIFLNSGREEEGQALLETAQALDPENMVAESLFRDKSPLSVETVLVPRLDDKLLEQEVQGLTADMPSPPRNPEPGAGLPPYRPPEVSEEAMPDWLRRLQEEERGSAGEPTASSSDSQGMPDWLQQLAEERAGGALEDTEPEANGPDQEQEPALAETGPDEADEETGGPEGPEIPLSEQAAAFESPAPQSEGEESDSPAAEEQADWLSQLRAQGTSEEERTPLSQDSEGDTPDWLGSLRAETSGESEGTEDEGEVPSWLLELRGGAAGEEAETDEGIVRDWGKLPPEEPREESLEPEPDALDDRSEAEGDGLEKFLQEAEESEISRETMERLRETMPDESDSIEDIMEWMEQSKTLLAAEGGPETDAEQGLEGLTPTREDEEIPTWLRDVRPDVQAFEEPLQGEAAEPPAGEGAVPTPEDEIPTWLRDLRPSAEEMSALPSEEEWEMLPEDETVIAAEETALPEEEPEATVEETPTTPPAEEEAPSWLLEVQAQASEEEPPLPVPEAEEAAEEPPAAEVEEVPTWLRQIREEAAEEASPPAEEVSPPAEEVSPPAEEISPPPAEEPEALAPEPAPPQAKADEVPSWLRELRAEAAAEQAAVSEEQEAGVEDLGVPAAEEVEMPSWLRQLRAEAAQQESAGPAEAPEPSIEEAAPVPSTEEEMPSWLRQLREEATSAPTLPVESSEDLGEEPPPHVVEAELPSWLQELRAEVAAEVGSPTAEIIEPEAEEEVPTPAEADEVPTWLREVRAEVETPEQVTPEEPEAPVEPPPLAPPEGAEVPSWLRRLRAQADEGHTDILMETAEAAAGEVPLGPPEAEELPSWLRELRAEGAARGPSAPFAEEEEAGAQEEPEPLPEAIRPAAVRGEEPAIPEIGEVDREAATAPRAEEPPGPGSATEEYRDYLKANPRDHNIRLALARAYSRQGNLDQAAEQYEVMLSYGGMLQEVKDDLEATAESAPDHLPTHELLADAYMRTGELQKALDKYRWLRLTLAR